MLNKKVGMMKKEIDSKHAKIRDILDGKGLEGLIFSSQTNFLWLSGGGLNNVIRNDDTSLVYLFFTKDKRYLITTSSEADRVMTEELNGLDFELVMYRWFDQDYTSALSKIGVKGKIGADFTDDNLVNIQDEIIGIRRDLSDFEVEKYLDFCMDYSELMTDYCLNINKGLTEAEIAAGLSDACFGKGIRLSVLMVGSDDRIFRYRHPCFTDKKIEKYILIATCAERDGIYANVSRSVYFGRTPAELIEKQKAVNYIYSASAAEAASGRSLSELFEIIKQAYKDAGFPDEWKNHHQGGISGYKPLEYVIDEKNNTRINNNNIMGFNPTITGAKTEDPVLIVDGSSQTTVFDDRWPYEEYEIKGKSAKRPLIMEL